MSWALPPAMSWRAARPLPPADGDGDGLRPAGGEFPQPPGLGDDARLFLVMLGVKDRMGDAFADSRDDLGCAQHGVESIEEFFLFRKILFDFLHHFIELVGINLTGTLKDFAQSGSVFAI